MFCFLESKRGGCTGVCFCFWQLDVWLNYKAFAHLGDTQSNKFLWELAKCTNPNICSTIIYKIHSQKYEKNIITKTKRNTYSQIYSLY